MTALILPKLGHCKNTDEVIRKLESMNARQVGAGNFSRVYRVEAMSEPEFKPLSYMDYRAVANLQPWEMMQPIRPSFASDRKAVIIKVCTKSDRGALLVAKAAMATSEIDPLAPVYHGIIEFSGSTFVAEIEELQPLKATRGKDTHGYEVEMFAEQVYVTGDRHRRRPLDSVVTQSPFLSLLSRYIDKGYCWDIHGHNVMMGERGPVITDPMYHNADC